ncbi:MAG TPA: polysaccharide deacetylase [Thermomicrobiales bacterium]|nr:polysaccharide deacetylase [Thermomicrobiales bacterium]
MSYERPVWPGDARCAVTLTFDNFGESFDLLRYGHAFGALADGVYAPRRGIERVLDLLERHGLPATFFVEGWNARKYTGLLREIAARGHEIAAHGWLHERWNTLPASDERDLIERATTAIADVLGAPPRGWRSPGGLMTPSTLGLLRGAGYAYDSSMADDDCPYLLQTGPDAASTLVELPWTWTLDDAVYFAHPGVIRHPRDVIDLWTDEFDAAWQLTGSFMLVCHPRYSGRPARVLALERLLDHIRQHDGVWFARCDEVAAHVARQPGTPRHPMPETAPPEPQ